MADGIAEKAAGAAAAGKIAVMRGGIGASRGDLETEMGGGREVRSAENPESGGMGRAKCAAKREVEREGQSGGLIRGLLLRNPERRGQICRADPRAKMQQNQPEENPLARDRLLDPVKEANRENRKRFQLLRRRLSCRHRLPIVQHRK